jgi:dihydroorotase
MSTAISVIGARVLDPVAGTDELRDLHVAGGVFVEQPAEGARRIAAQGLTLAPGLIDARVFKVDSAACAAGGITRLCLMPDLSPPLEHAAAIAQAATLGEGRVHVHPYVAATKGLRGEEIAEIGLGKRASAVAVSTGRAAIGSARVMQRLLTYAKGFGLVVVAHAEEPTLVQDSVATESEFATRMGLPAAPAFAETLQVVRDIMLAEAIGARLHIAQVTTADTIDAVRAAKRRGVAVTCGVTPAHMLMNDGAIGSWRTFARLSPPLRSESDRLAVVAGLVDGTIDLICSGHDPRTAEDKRVPFAQSAPGMVGVETLLSLALGLAHNEYLSMVDVIAKITQNPAHIFGLPQPTLAVGAAADFVLFDDGAPWRLTEDSLVSAAKNTPFEAMPLQGRVQMTFLQGACVFERAKK